ncbi:MAG: substrate-binding domain-containing protein [Tannerellaceae bacterium]|jgi:ABC-type phosphate transport system substrate-binding protein|nr:substrate-binding domain-containing protein [Tannerellaceae bacterium]
MKTFRLFLILAVLPLFAGSTKAADSNQDIIYVSSAKFTWPLIEKWVSEYVRQNPGVRIQWVDKSSADNNSKEIDLSFVTGDESGVQAGKDIAVGRFAILPITTKENPLYGQIVKKKFGKKELRNLFFAEDLLQEEENGKKNPLQSKLTVYTGNGSASGSLLFASFFGFSPSNFRGKRISGDDIFLLNAIQKDSTGVTFNNLSYIFDLNDRRLKDEIALLPLDVKKEQLQALRSENLDETLALLEQQHVELIPVHPIEVVYTEKDHVKDFLKWIITDGQKYNHEYGFLNPDEKTFVYQKKRLETSLLTNN